jgi:hypothetical protein
LDHEIARSGYAKVIAAAPDNWTIRPADGIRVFKLPATTGTA